MCNRLGCEQTGLIEPPVGAVLNCFRFELVTTLVSGRKGRPQIHDKVASVSYLATTEIGFRPSTAGAFFDFGSFSKWSRALFRFSFPPTAKDLRKLLG